MRFGVSRRILQRASTAHKIGLTIDFCPDLFLRQQTLQSWLWWNCFSPILSQKIFSYHQTQSALYTNFHRPTLLHHPPSVLTRDAASDSITKYKTCTITTPSLIPSATHALKPKSPKNSQKFLLEQFTVPIKKGRWILCHLESYSVLPYHRKTACPRKASSAGPVM